MNKQRKTIKNKGIRRKTRRIKRSIKKYGGVWPWSGMFTNNTPTAVSAVPSEKVGIQRLMGNQERLQKDIDNANIGTAATAVASGVITTLAASGVGMPVAALLAGALLITNKMFELFRTNLVLRLLMKDAIFIIMDCFLLFRLIEKSYDVIGGFEDPKNKCEPNPNQQVSPEPDQSSIRKKKYEINKFMQVQLEYQILKLIGLLMHLIDTKTLKMLMAEPTLDNGFGQYLKDEEDKREKEAGYFSMSKMTRNYDRKFGGSYYITEINNVLTIMNSYIILLKSNLDMVLKKFEILEPVEYEKIWREILCSLEYNSYIKPVTSDVMKEAEAESNKVNGAELTKNVTLVEKAGEEASV